MATRTRTKTVKPEPEIDLSEYLAREPSPVNKAEAAWLVDCTGLELDGEADMELVEQIVMLVAGGAHRAWQKSEAAAEIHAERAERTAAAKAERLQRQAERASEDDGEKPRRGRPRKPVVEDDEEEAVPAPKPRRGRPKATAVVEEEEEAPRPTKRRGAARRSSEAPF